MKFIMFVVSDAQPDSPLDESDIDLWVDPLDASGKRVIGEVLAPTAESTVVRVRGGKVLTTRGPFVETSEVILGFDILDVAKEIADRHGVSVAQIALAWILANSAVTSVIIGARKPAQLEDNLKAIDVKLSGEDMKALDEVSKLTTEYPAWLDNLGTDRRPGERRY